MAASISKGMGISLDELINQTDGINVDISFTKNISPFREKEIDLSKYPACKEYATYNDIKIIEVYSDSAKTGCSDPQTSVSALTARRQKRHVQRHSLV